MDVGGSFLYFNDNNTGVVKRANLDGTGVVTLATGFTSVFGLAVDTTAGYIFVSELGGNIKRMALDGSGVTTIATSLSTPEALEVHSQASKLYVAEYGAGRVRSMNYDGSGSTILFTGMTHAGSLAISPATGKFYASGFSTGTFHVGNLDGSGSLTSFTGLDQSYDLAVLKATPSPTPTPTNTSTPTPTNTPTPTPTNTPTPAPTNTPTPVPTNTPTPAPTNTPTPVPTNTPTPAPTNTPTPVPTNTPTPVPTNTPTPVPTSTTTSVPTNTPSPVPTDTPTPTSTPASAPTDTPAPTPTATPTSTPSPTVPGNSQTIRGRIIDGDTLNPVPGVVVYLYAKGQFGEAVSLAQSSEQQPLEASITDSSGEYLFKNLAVGNYLVRFRRSLTTFSQDEVGISPGQEPVEVIAIPVPTADSCKAADTSRNLTRSANFAVRLSRLIARKAGRIERASKRLSSSRRQKVRLIIARGNARILDQSNQFFAQMEKLPTTRLVCSQKSRCKRESTKAIIRSARAASKKIAQYGVQIIKRGSRLLPQANDIKKRFRIREVRRASSTLHRRIARLPRSSYQCGRNGTSETK